MTTQNPKDQTALLPVYMVIFIAVVLAMAWMLADLGATQDAMRHKPNINDAPYYIHFSNGSKLDLVMSYDLTSDNILIVTQRYKMRSQYGGLSYKWILIQDHLTYGSETGWQVINREAKP